MLLSVRSETAIHVTPEPTTYMLAVVFSPQEDCISFRVISGLEPQGQIQRSKENKGNQKVEPTILSEAAISPPHPNLPKKRILTEKDRKVGRRKKRGVG